ncbi:MAG: helix-hairpin-helix domain-containing protein [Anaerolineales bacterium]|nr:helix-hairpin-helix domain-containing protein [Anaerolineales bacterium]
MDRVLNFLNTASIESLTNISGITQPVAEGLIAARPFDSVDECLKVKGMGKNLLARIQAAAEANVSEEADQNALPAPKEEPAPLTKSQPADKHATKEEKPSFGSRLGVALLAFLRALVRLILIVLLIGGIGAAVYFGLPILRERYIAPVEQNISRVAELENEVADLKTQLTELDQRVDQIDASIEAHTAALEKLEAMQTTLETQIKNNNDATLVKLKQEVMMTRALDTLARARLYLAQSNFGLAKEDVQSARDILSELEAQSNDEVLSQAIARLDLALGNLPDFPVVASGDLEIAWQILMTGHAAVTATAEPTPTTTVTPQPTLEVTVTATP